jgi:hypothetical protein
MEITSARYSILSYPANQHNHPNSGEMAKDPKLELLVKFRQQPAFQVVRSAK